MPQIGNKRFPYTPSGIKQANEAMTRKQQVSASIRRIPSNRPPGTRPLDKMYRPAFDGPKRPPLTGGVRPGRKIKKYRGALANRPIRRPSARPGMRPIRRPTNRPKRFL